MCEIKVMPEEMVPDELVPGVPGTRTLKRLVADALLIENPIGTVVQVDVLDIEAAMDMTFERFISHLDHTIYKYGARMGLPLRLTWTKDLLEDNAGSHTVSVLFKVQYD